MMRMISWFGEIMRVGSGAGQWLIVSRRGLVLFLLLPFFLITLLLPDHAFATTLALPSGLSPANGATSVSTAPSLSWNSVPGSQIVYRVQLGTSPSFSTSNNDTVCSNCTVNNGQTATSYSVSGLSPNTTYYWRIRAGSNDGVTVQSGWATASFTTAPPPALGSPSGLSPVNGATGVSTAPQLSWNAVSGSQVVYRVQLGTSPSFSTSSNDTVCTNCTVNSGPSTTSYNVSGLSPNTTYYWRVRAGSNDGVTVQSGWTTASFTTAPPPILAAPSGLSPANGTTGISYAPLLSWNAVSGSQVVYRVQLGTSPSFITSNNDTVCSNCTVNSGPSTTSYNVSGLSPNTTYYWRVRAGSTDGVTVQSGWATASFTTAPQASGTCPSTLSYDQGIIIPDNEIHFVDIPIAAIQQFLVDKGSILANLNLDIYHLDPNHWSTTVPNWNLAELKDDKPTTQRYTAAEIIYLAAKENNVNPVILLAYLQKENSLIERQPQSIQSTLNSAVGYGVTSNGTDTRYSGFLAQLTSLSFQTNQDISGFIGAYTKTVDGTAITINSAFAHFHYKYTPHVLSAETLFKVYGSDNNYRGYFLGKGYALCGGSSQPTPPPTADPWIPQSDGFDMPVKGSGWQNKQIFENNLGTLNGVAYNGYHPGEDWNWGNGSDDVGQPVYATANGKVLFIRDSGDLGFGVIIEHQTDSASYFSVYYHVNPVAGLLAGAPVYRGMKIAEIGNFPGIGPHVHFELRNVRPGSDLYPNDNGKGYYSTIDKLREDGFFMAPSLFVQQNQTNPADVTPLMTDYRNDSIISSTLNRYYIDNRATFMAILIGALEKRAGKSLSLASDIYFDDIPADAWYRDVILKALSLDLLSKPADKKYRPGDPITRIEALAFVVRVYEQYLSAITPKPVRVFDDITDTADWTYTVAQKGSAAQLTALTSGNFYPNHWTPRGEVVAFVDNVITKLNSSQSVGVCGSANGTTVVAAPTTNLCSVGTASTVSGNGPWTWTCTGDGTPASCSANKAAPSYTVTPSAGSNGSISPATAQTVNSGATTTFTITPNSGYTASVSGCGGTLTGTTYTTGSITAACTVSASFSAPPTALGAPTNVTATAGNGQATVSFTAPANNGSSPITGYTVTSNPGNKTATSTVSPIIVTGLTNNTPYTFTVTATNSVGTGAASAASISVTPAPSGTTQPALDLGTAGGSPGKQVTVPITLTNVTGVQIGTIRLDIGYNTALLSNPTVAIGAAGTSAGKTLISSSPAAGAFRFALYDLNNTTIGNGVVANVTFTVASTVTTGTSVQLANTPTASNPSGNDVSVTGQNGTVNIVILSGDCNGDGNVSTSEFTSTINVFMGKAAGTACVSFYSTTSVTPAYFTKVINAFMGR